MQQQAVVLYCSSSGPSTYMVPADLCRLNPLTYNANQLGPLYTYTSTFDSVFRPHTKRVQLPSVCEIAWRVLPGIRVQPRGSVRGMAPVADTAVVVPVFLASAYRHYIVAPGIIYIDRGHELQQQQQYYMSSTRASRFENCIHQFG